MGLDSMVSKDTAILRMDTRATMVGIASRALNMSRCDLANKLVYSGTADTWADK